MGATIGIDLGTTNSCMATVEGGKTTVIPNAEGARTTPSVVAFSKEGERLVGTVACRQAAMNPDRTFASVKRHMGTNWRAKVDGKAYTPQELSAMILRKMRQDAEAFLGASVTDAVITVPAYFDDMQRQATKDAGRIAGLNVLRIINEPTAAALAYGLDNGSPQKVMVYDLGGGTFDVSIIEIGEGVIEVLATAGDNHLGGDDFDERLAEYLIGEFKRQSGVDVSHDRAAMQRVLDAARAAKAELSSLTSTRVNLPFLAQNATGPLHMDIELTRARFENMIRDLIERTTDPVQQALFDAGIAASELGQVLLVGGSTRVPAVQAHVRALTGKTPSSSVNPDECVACGAAVQGSTLSSASLGIVPAHGDILLLDVVPLSLSVETVGGVATRLIERNTTLPAHYSQVFSTAAAFQTSVEIRVLQGERPMAADNKTIGTFHLKGIKRAPAGVPQIEVTFDIDANGILVVSAKDLDTGKQQSVTITDTERMSDAEIEAAIADAERYAAQDSARREEFALREDARRLLAEVDAALAKAGKQVDKDEKRRVKADASDLRKLVDVRPAPASGSAAGAGAGSRAKGSFFGRKKASAQAAGGNGAAAGSGAAAGAAGGDGAGSGNVGRNASAIREAMARLEQSSAHIRSLTGE